MVARYIKLHTSEIRQGMFIADLDRPWLDTPFLIQGFMLEEEEDRLTLQRLCQYVYVDPVRSRIDLMHHQARLMPPNVTPTSYVDEVPVEQELPRASETYQRTRDVVERVVQDVYSGSHLHLENVNDVVGQMVESIASNPDALMWVARLRGEDSRAYEHGVRVGIYLLAFGRHLGFPVTEMHHLGMIGLLLDLGKTKIPRDMLEKRAKLTPEEFEEIKHHVDYGVEMLSSSAAVHASVLEGIAQHHERLNGQGYPKGLQGEEIGIYGRMAAIADCFAALTAPRPYNVTISPSEALTKLYESSGEYFHGPLIERFIHAIGVYPVGTLVELSTGEVGIVIRHNRFRRLQPTVLVIRDRDKQPLDRPVEIDLLYQHADTTDAPVRVRKGLPADAFGIDTRAYYIGQNTPSR